MAEIEILLSDPEAVGQYRLVVETALAVGGPLTEPLRSFLEQRATELKVHRLDADQVLAAVLSLPAVQTALGVIEAQREQEQQDQKKRIAELEAELRNEQHSREILLAELHAEQQYRTALAGQLGQSLTARLLQQINEASDDPQHGNETTHGLQQDMLQIRYQDENDINRNSIGGHLI